MSEAKASRTLLKSPPELWSEVSTATSLQRHMDQFGEIRITKLEPETAVAWEGEHARGTITLEVSGWGTKVSLTAEPTGDGAVDATEPEAAVRVEPTPDRVKPESLVERAAPERSVLRTEPESLTTRVEPEPAGSAQQDQLHASMQRPRWTRRVAEAFRKWLSPPLEEDSVSFAHAPEPKPSHSQPELSHAEPKPAHSQPEPAHAEPKPSHSQPEPAHPAAWATPVEPEPDRPVASRTLPAPAQPTPPQEAPRQIDKASRAALDATLDSLGQAHHRPFSRA